MAGAGGRGHATKALSCNYWAHVPWNPGITARERPAHRKEDAAQPKLANRNWEMPREHGKAEGKNPMKHRFVNAPIRALRGPPRPRMQLISITSSSHTISSWRISSLSCSHSLKTKLTFLQTKISNLNVFWKATTVKHHFSCTLVPSFFVFFD